MSAWMLTVMYIKCLKLYSHRADQIKQMSVLI
jgi:hypothetical protein